MNDSSPAVRRFAMNREGRDFVVGDLHGAFRVLDEALAQVRFDPNANAGATAVSGSTALPSSFIVDRRVYIRADNVPGADACIPTNPRIVYPCVSLIVMSPKPHTARS